MASRIFSLRIAAVALAAFLGIFAFTFVYRKSHNKTDNKKIVLEQTVYNTDEKLSFYGSMNKFALDMYAATDKITDKKSNIFFSPYSVYLAFGMLYEGATGESEKQLGRIFGFEKNSEIRHNLFKNEMIKYGSGDSPFLAANSLWFRPQENINDSFKQTLSEYYLSETKHTLDIDQINSWVSEKTKNKINKVLKRGDINNDTLLVLLNAVYFKAFWKYPFDEEQTYTGKFYISDNKSVNVDMMKQKNYFFLGFEEEVYLLRMTYKLQQHKISMIIVMPRRGYSIESAEKFVMDNSMETILEKISKKREIILSFPKFEMKTKMDLLEITKILGLESYNGFKNISEAAELTKAEHGAYILVDEKGTEAAAYTLLSMTKSSDRPDMITIDRPFVYMIVDETDNKILFMGRTINPLDKGN